MQVWLNTDGGKTHFKCRISFYFYSTLDVVFGIRKKNYFEVCVFDILLHR
jgi:hypothetical protein